MNNSPYQRIDLTSDGFNKNEPANNIPIESILYSNYIRYDRLKELTLRQFAYSNENILNIYIDMYTIMRPLYKRNYIYESSIFASTILNLAAHLRSYYWSRHKVATNIYIIMTNNSNCLANEFAMYPEWNMNDCFIPNPKRDEILKWNIQLLRLLIPYFPNLYFIEGTVEPSVMIYNLIRTSNTSHPNVILTKDLMSWQIPALDLNSCIFRPRKSKDEDTSFCINKINVYGQWRHTVNNSRSSMEVNLPSEMLSLYIALTSFKKRGLSSYFSPKTALAYMSKLVQDNQIQYGYNSSDAIKNVLVSIDKNKSKTLYHRYNVVDLVRLTNIYSTLPESHNRSWEFSKIDPISIKEINDKFFIRNPIDIIKLMDNPGV
jgi:hypothetical protein